MEQQGAGEVSLTHESAEVKAKYLFENLSLAHKRYALFEDMLMVMDGLKNATDYSFPGDTYTQEEFSQFQSLLKNVGLRLTEPDIGYSNDGSPRRSGFVFNPEALKRNTANSELTLPYDGVTDLKEYMRQAIDAGFDYASVIGKVFSFPESAIRDFLVKQRGGIKSKIIDVFKPQHTARSYGETYWYYGEPKQDVIDREYKKHSFFQRLSNSETYQDMIKSPLLKQSDQAWTARLPKFMQH